MQNHNDNKTKYNKSLIWFVELLIWFLVLVFIASAIMIGKYYYKKNFNSYQIFLQDVDGLIVGSPVRMMGIQVGYVKQVDIVNDLVFIDFIITEKNIKIPKGSVVTVEFNGLGGSKSLEVYSPERVATIGESYLIIQNPRRIHDIFGLINEMYDKITSISYICSTFVKEFNNVDKPQKTKFNKNPEVILRDTNKWIDDANANIDNMNKYIKRYANEQK